MAYGSSTASLVHIPPLIVATEPFVEDHDRDDVHRMYVTTADNVLDISHCMTRKGANSQCVRQLADFYYLRTYKSNSQHSEASVYMKIYNQRLYAWLIRARFRPLCDDEGPAPALSRCIFFSCMSRTISRTSKPN